MAPHDLRRPFKRSAVSDQQRRRELALSRQDQQRAEHQARARRLFSTLLSDRPEPELDSVPDADSEVMDEDAGAAAAAEGRVSNVLEASKLRGWKARRWFARQLMFPEWMIDVPPHLDREWYVFPRPSGKRCFVVSCNGTTVSRLRNGSILHRFPSSLPNGSKAVTSGPASDYSILDCIFHEPDQTYYVIDMVYWRGYSIYDCTSEFRFHWMKSKLVEENNFCNLQPSTYHKYRFVVLPNPINECDRLNLDEAYTGTVPYVKDGLLFFNKHAHYQAGNTPLALLWKDESCSEYFIDTDNNGEVLAQQQVVLELQIDGKLTTCDDPPIVFGNASGEFLRESGLRPGSLLRFNIKDEAVRIMDGRLEIGDMQYIGKTNRARAFADNYSKVLFQYYARHSPLRFGDLKASISPRILGADEAETPEIEMAG